MYCAGKITRTTPVLCCFLLAICLLIVAMLGGCTQQEEVSASSPENEVSSVTPESEEREAMYKDYSLEGSLQLGVFPSSQELVTFIQYSDANAISLCYIFDDSYGDYLGDYFVEYNSANPSSTDKISVDGLSKASSAIAYVYSYKLKDGTEWGNRDATMAEIVAYGHLLDVGINTLKSNSVNSAKSSDSGKSNTSNSASTEASKTAGDYILPDSDSRYYSKADLSGLSDWELYIARNEIYARHGRGFTNQDLAEYFSKKSWYTKKYDPEEFDAMPSLLNDYEKKNADTMLSIEQDRESPYL